MVKQKRSRVWIQTLICLPDGLSLSLYFLGGSSLCFCLGQASEALLHVVLLLFDFHFAFSVECRIRFHYQDNGTTHDVLPTQAKTILKKLPRKRKPNDVHIEGVIINYAVII